MIIPLPEPQDQRLPQFKKRVASDYPTAAEVKRERQRLMKAGRHDLAALLASEKTREEFENEQRVTRARRVRRAEERASLALAAKQEQKRINRGVWNQALAEKRDRP